MKNRRTNTLFMDSDYKTSGIKDINVETRLLFAPPIY